MEFFTQLDTGVQIAIVSGITAIVGYIFAWLRTKAMYSKKISDLENEVKRLELLTPANIEKQYSALVKLYDEAITQIEDLKYELGQSEILNEMIEKEKDEGFILLYKVLNETQQKLKKGKSVAINETVGVSESVHAVLIKPNLVEEPKGSKDNDKKNTNMTHYSM